MNFSPCLEENAIGKLIDIRRFPGSRRFPQFNREALVQALADASIDYRHEPLLGGRRPTKAESVNDYWGHPSFRGYADYMATDEFGQAVDHVQQDSRESNLVLMCAEAVPLALPPSARGRCPGGVRPGSDPHPGSKTARGTSTELPCAPGPGRPTDLLCRHGPVATRVRRSAW